MRLQQQRLEDFEYIISMLRRLQADANISGATGDFNNGQVQVPVPPPPPPPLPGQQQRQRTLARRPSEGFSSPSLMANRRLISQRRENNDRGRRGGGGGAGGGGGGPTMHRPMH